MRMVVVIAKNVDGKDELLYTGENRVEARKVYTEKIQDKESYQVVYMFTRHAYRTISREGHRIHNEKRDKVVATKKPAAAKKTPAKKPAAKKAPKKDS